MTTLRGDKRQKVASGCVREGTNTPGVLYESLYGDPLNLPPLPRTTVHGVVPSVGTLARRGPVA